MHLIDVFCLKQVHRLESLVTWHTQCLHTLKEVVNVFHLLEWHLALCNFDGGKARQRDNFVDGFTNDHTILQGFMEGV